MEVETGKKRTILELIMSSITFNHSEYCTSTSLTKPSERPSDHSTTRDHPPLTDMETCNMKDKEKASDKDKGKEEEGEAIRNDDSRIRASQVLFRQAATLHGTCSAEVMSNLGWKKRLTVVGSVTRRPRAIHRALETDPLELTAP
jgi:hypothetical protein